MSMVGRPIQTSATFNAPKSCPLIDAGQRLESGRRIGVSEGLAPESDLIALGLACSILSGGQDSSVLAFGQVHGLLVFFPFG